MTKNPDCFPDTIPGLLTRAAETYGDAPAIQWSRGIRSYRALAADSAALAKGLVAMGVGKGSRVAILSGNSWLMVRSLFACAQVGAIVIPISTLATPVELAHIIKHCDAQLLLTMRRHAGRDYGELIARALPELAGSRSKSALRLHGAPFLRSIWLDDPQGISWAGSVDDLVVAGASDATLDDRFLGEIQAEVTSADEAIIIYTSGSTALPKAVVHTHGPVVRQARALAEAQIAFPAERVLCAMPLFWVGGMNLLLEAMTVGSCFIVSEDVSVEGIARAISNLGAEAFLAWPTQRSRIRDFMAAHGLDYSTVRGLRVERRPDGSPKSDAETPNALGMTETFGPHGILPVGSVLPLRHQRGAFAPVSNGFERRVVDSDTREVMETGRTGELQVRGGSLMKGYYKTERGDVFTTDGFFSTGDIVRIEEDGFMYFEGRSGDTLKTNGANVSRLEVEGALRSIPGLVEAVVCGLPDPGRGQLVVAAVVLTEGENIDEIGIKAILREKLSSYKIPSHIVFVSQNDIPLTGSGKVRLSEMSEIIMAKIGK